MTRFLGAMILVALAYGAAFFFWVSTLPPPPTVKPDTDGIVVLTGGEPRLDIAVGLLESGVGKRLLISGVSTTTSRESVKQVSGGGARFNCCADIGYAADTRGNAEEAAEWAHNHHFRSVAVVTARYHMPRAMHEFSRAMPDVTLLPYPVDQDGIDLSGWWGHPQTVQLLNREFAKYLGSLASSLIPR